MSYRSERFNNAMRSVDFESISSDKNRATSDGGLGVERMMEAIEEGEKIGQENSRLRNATACQGCTADDSGLISREWDTRVHESDRDEREEALFVAQMRLVDAGKGYLIRVLLLIVENGANREDSLKNVARRTYFLHRNQLVDFFC